MKRFYFVFLLLFIMLTGWGCAQKPDSTPSVVPTTTSNQPAAPVTTTTTPPVTVATTTPDNAVSTTAWHRFSFSELGFSIQLPFEEGRITASLQEDTSKKMSWFKGYLKGKSAEYNFLGSVSDNYVSTGPWQLTEIKSLAKVGDTYHIGEVEIHPVQLIPVQEKLLVMFDANKDFYRFTESDYGKSGGQRYGAVFTLPAEGKKFKAVVLIFKEEDVNYNQLVAALKTVQFFKQTTSGGSTGSVSTPVAPKPAVKPPKPTAPFVFKEDGGSNPYACGNQPTGGAATKWVYRCTKKTSFAAGDTAWGLIRLNSVFKDYRFKVQAFKEGVLQWETVSNWNKVDHTWGSNQIYFWVSVPNISEGNWVLQYYVDTGEGFSSRSLVANSFSVGSIATNPPPTTPPSSNKPPFVFNSAKICGNEPQGGAYSNWAYSCTEKTTFNPGETAYPLLRLDKVYKSYRVKFDFYRDVYIPPEGSGRGNFFTEEHDWRPVDSTWGYDKIFAWTDMGSLRPGKWRVRYYVDVGNGFSNTPVATSYFTVNDPDNPPEQGYLYDGNYDLCSDQPVGTAANNWFYHCSDRRYSNGPSFFRTGETAYLILRIDKVYVNHRFRVDTYKDNVLQNQEITPFKVVNTSDGWVYSFFTPTIATNLQAGTWNVYVYVSTPGQDWKRIKSLNFEVK
jgi:hypothetical protein